MHCEIAVYSQDVSSLAILAGLYSTRIRLNTRLESARAREVTLQTPWVQGEGKGRGGRKGLSRHHRSAEDLPTRAWEPRSSPLSSPSKQVQHLFHFICVSHTQRWTQRQVRHSYALRAHGGQWGEPREQAACPACPLGGRSLATGGAAPWGAQRPGGALGVEPCSTPREEPASHPGKDGATCWGGILAASPMNRRFLSHWVSSHKPREGEARC